MNAELLELRVKVVSSQNELQLKKAALLALQNKLEALKLRKNKQFLLSLKKFLYKHQTFPKGEK